MAMYGLREAPSLWQDERTSDMTKVRTRVNGICCRKLLSQSLALTNELNHTRFSQ